MVAVAACGLLPVSDAVVDIGDTADPAFELEECDAEAEDVLEDKNCALNVGFEDRYPAVRSVSLHPLLQAEDLQQPMNGGFVYAQVYHLLSDGHSWSANFPYWLGSKLAGSKFPAEQPLSSHGSSLQHPTKFAPTSQAKNVPPLGHEGLKNKVDIENRQDSTRKL